MFKCPECELFFNTKRFLQHHCKHIHQISSEDLYIRVFNNGVKPACACGCGETPKFYNIETGYTKYIRGHHSRVHNNWGHNESAKKKSRETINKMVENGEIVAWNKGLTKETDDRVKTYATTLSEQILSDQEEREKRATRMSTNRLTRVIPSLTGSSHPAWKGGSSSYQMLTRSSFHIPWVYPKLKAANFTCQHCGHNKNLCVHHNVETFSEILHKALAATQDKASDDFEYKKIVSDWVVAYHLDNNVSGIVLCEDCHTKAHQAL